LMGQVYAPGSLIIFEATIIIVSVTNNYARNSLRNLTTDNR
jgi:hypothetical protein